MFRVSEHPSSGILKTVTAASGTGQYCEIQGLTNEVSSFVILKKGCLFRVGLFIILRVVVAPWIH